MDSHHHDLLIRIGGWDKDLDAYPVEAQLGDGSFFFGGRLKLDKSALLAQELDAAAYGQTLFAALFSGPIAKAYERAVGYIRSSEGHRLRLRLWIDDAAAELHGIAWERLHHEWDGAVVPLTTAASFPFSRYFSLPIAEPEPIIDRPVRLLLAVANPPGLPDGLVPVDVATEIENVRAALSDFRQAGRVDVTIMPGRTGLPDDLRSQLSGEKYEILDGSTSLDNITRQLPRHHIFYFIGHGVFKARRGGRGEGRTALFLENEAGDKYDAVDDEDMVKRLKSLIMIPHLFFLVACESGAQAAQAQHPFVGLAPKLLAGGVPAVIAMQQRIPILVARELIRDFTRYLTAHGYVDMALNQARLLLYESDRIDWAIPALFSRLEGGQLFGANPVHTAIEAVRAATEMGRPDGFLPLPIEVVHLTGRQDAAGLEQLRLADVPTQDLMSATLNVYASSYQAESRGKPVGQRAPFVALIGGRGTSKSTQMRRLAWFTALEMDAEREILPIYVDLVGYPNARRTAAEPMLQTIAQGLSAFWPNADAETIADLFARDKGPILRLFVDGSDDLPDSERRSAWMELQRLFTRHPRHELMMSTTAEHLGAGRLRASDVLVIQPLATRKIRSFLHNRGSEGSLALAAKLNEQRLFDLASLPWLLVRMLNQAEEGILPESRTSVLRGYVEDAVDKVSDNYGMRARARASLYALAWEMQARRVTRLTQERMLALLAEVRGSREYRVSDLFQELVNAGLLAPLAEDQVRFAYPPVQAYCCAQAIAGLADREPVLDDITATLGRLSRLRWWEDTLVYLSGILIGRPLYDFMDQLVFGVNLLESPQTEVAVKCMLEMERNGQTAPKIIAEQVLDALKWRLDPSNETSETRRLRAVDDLEQLRAYSAVPQLAAMANQKIRQGHDGTPEFERSYMRMAAVLALYHLMPEALPAVTQDDPLLVELLTAAHETKDDLLLQGLNSPDPETQALSAFLLSERQADQKALMAIVAAFQTNDVETQTRWALAEALTRFDPQLVTEKAIMPLIDEAAAQAAKLDPAVWENRANWYRELTYLIGQIRTQTPAAQEFLNTCLHDHENVWLQGKAIEALGWLYEYRHKLLFEAIAVGDFQRLLGSVVPPPEEAQYLQRKALIALGYIGDKGTFNRLRQGRENWTVELERVYYRTGEELNWRLSLSR